MLLMTWQNLASYVTQATFRQIRDQLDAIIAAQALSQIRMGPVSALNVNQDCMSMRRALQNAMPAQMELTLQITDRQNA